MKIVWLSLFMSSSVLFCALGRQSSTVIEDGGEVADRVLTRAGLDPVIAFAVGASFLTEHGMTIIECRRRGIGMEEDWRIYRENDVVKATVRFSEPCEHWTIDITGRYNDAAVKDWIAKGRFKYGLLLSHQSQHSIAQALTDDKIFFTRVNDLKRMVQR